MYAVLVSAELTAWVVVLFDTLTVGWRSLSVFGPFPRRHMSRCFTSGEDSACSYLYNSLSV